jgi:hypothetical protein
MCGIESMQDQKLKNKKKIERKENFLFNVSLYVLLAILDTVMQSCNACVV